MGLYDDGTQFIMYFTSGLMLTLMGFMEITIIEIDLENRVEEAYKKKKRMQERKARERKAAKKERREMEIKMMQEIRRIMEFSADRIRGVRCIICEKKSAKSKDLINRSRNTFAAGKTEDGTIIYADCTIRQYEQIIVNETTGLFYIFDGDEKIRIVAE